PDAHPLAYFMRGFLAVLQSDPTGARPMLHRAAMAAQDAGQASLRSQSLSMASIAERMAAEHVPARRLLEEAHLVATDPDDFLATIALLQARALNSFFEGDLDAVRSASAEGVRLGREMNDLYSLEMMLMNLGLAALIAGDLSESKPLL